MKLLEAVKSHSSKWVKSKDKNLINFYWQDGYSAFSVNPRGLERVSAYIAGQAEHHGGQNFQDELRGLFKKYKIEYDERYVWD